MDLSGCGKIRQTAVESFTYEDVQINYFEHLDHLRETKDLAGNRGKPRREHRVPESKPQPGPSPLARPKGLINRSFSSQKTETLKKH
jgi:hypothetical protein